MDDENTYDNEATPANITELVTRAEINQQIATAKQYPRQISRFMEEAKTLVTLTEQIASECIYALPREGKNIEGPSSRFAEVLASSWGNCRAGARVIGEDEGFVTSQGIFHDLERNVAIQYEVKRRITDKYGRRYKPDMIGVTANAACSIALRNAILKGIPKAFWSAIYEAARKTVMGDAKTLVNRRAEAMQYLQKLGAPQDKILSVLNVRAVDDITEEHLTILRGIATAIKDGDTTVEDAFSKEIKPATIDALKAEPPSDVITEADRAKYMPPKDEAALIGDEWPKVTQDGKFVDSAGQEFNPSLHSDPHKLNADATFRARRGAAKAAEEARKEAQKEVQKVAGEQPPDTNTKDTPDFSQVLGMIKEANDNGDEALYEDVLALIAGFSGTEHQVLEESAMATAKRHNWAPF